MPTPAISVAMSVYNGERFLAPAIESVLSQDFADFEFLILDDGSTDASPAIIRRYAGRDSRIVPIFRQNRGLVASLNALLAMARAPVIARMDADDISRSDRFARQIAFLNENPDYGVVGSWTEDIDRDGAPYPVSTPDHPIDHAAFLEAIEHFAPLICHPVAMYRTEVVRAVGGYHAAFRHCEDYDLWLRLAQVTQIGNLPERLIRYRRYENQVSSRHSTEQQVGAAIAYLAHRERAAGRTDPTARLERLPPVDELDALFGREGVARWVRARVAPSLVYSRAGLRGEGFEMLCRYLGEGGDRTGMWRVVARLLRFGAPVRALRLAAILARSA
ncbi:glycosyltransferase [Novosphingobium soli]|uniref:Glycosyltransferase n=1 Tax=Novosphingobium soli TaxID=574956 RepID=A0ABV6CXD3_9SPHN